MEVDDLSLDESEAVDYADQMAIMSKISSNTSPIHQASVISQTRR